MSSPPVLPWKWVIEYLADIPDVDTSILSALLDMFPDVLADSSRAVRERLALRCLEECAGMVCGETPPAVATNPPSTSVSAATIDAALTCEEVLLSKVATAKDDGEGKACLDDSDLHQFILLKRATLPKSSIDLLKERILGSHYPDRSCSKECGGLHKVWKPSCVNRASSNNHGDHDGMRKIMTTKKQGNPLMKKLAIIRKFRKLKEASREISTSQQHFVKQNVPNGDSDDFEGSLRSRQRSEKHNVLHDGADSRELDDVDCDDLQLEQSSMPQSSSSRSLCIKCSRSGQLLNCSGDGCSRSVHESCLRQLAGVEENGLFYCPFCAYRNARIMYQKSKRKAREARRNLFAFYDIAPTTNVPKTKISSAEITTGSDKESGDHRSSEHPNSPAHEQLRNSSGVPKHDGNGNFVRDDVQGIPQNQQDKLDGEDDMFCKIILPCRETIEGHIHQMVEDTPMKLKSKLATAKVTEDQQPVDNHGVDENGGSPCDDSRHHERNGEGDQLQAEEIKNVHNCDDADQEQISLQANERLSLKFEGECDHNAKRKALASQISGRFAKRNRRDDKAVKVDNHRRGSENQQTGSSSSRELRKSANRQNLSLVLKRPPSRRAKLNWKPEEEKILEEAMQQIPKNDDGSIPWTKILEYGRRLLHESRTPIDLKDKWRNMQKRESKNRA